MYFAGQGVDRDYAEAKKWFSLAAAHAYAPAQNSLGIIFDEGLGVSRDYAAAVKWFRHGAEQGHTPAQLRLSLQYVDGHGVAKDYTEAVKWLNIAAELGEDVASRYREALIGLMTPEEVAKAQSMAHLWLLRNRR